VDKIYFSVVRSSSTLISLTRLKNNNNYTYMHSVAACALVIALGRKMEDVCDVYDAITSNRSYKNTSEPASSTRKIASWKGPF